MKRILITLLALIIINCGGNLLSLRRAIQKFEKTAEALFFTVKFVSEIISAKKNQDNKIVEGDPNKIKTVIDHWKFTKKISSVNPNWYLAEIKNP